MDKVYEYNRNIILPNSWVYSKLCDFCEVMDVNHKMPKKVDNGVLFISPKDLTENGIEFTNAGKISRKDFEKLSRKCKPQLGDLIYSRIGTIGKVRIVPDKEFGISYSLCLIRPKLSIIELKYLFYQLQSNQIIQQAFRNRSKRIPNLPFLGLGEIRNFVISIAPLNEQQSIVSKLEELLTKLDAGINFLKNAQMLLKQYRKSFLVFAFEGKLTEKWRKNQRNQSKSDHDIKQSMNYFKKNENKTRYMIQKKWDVPEDWKWILLKDICVKITDGQRLGPKPILNGIPFLSAKNLHDEGISFKDVLYVEEKEANIFRKKCDPEKDDVLVVSRGATIGKTCLVNTSRVFGLLGSVILLKLSKNVNNKFIYYMFKSSHMQSILLNLSGSTAQPAIYLNDIKNIVIPIPHVQEQIVISHKLDVLFSIYENISNNIEKIIQSSNNLRGSILKSTFEGKLVSQAPNDVSMSLLLKKIKQEKSIIVSNNKKRNLLPTKYND